MKKKESNKKDKIEKKRLSLALIYPGGGGGRPVWEGVSRVSMDTSVWRLPYNQLHWKFTRPSRKFFSTLMKEKEGQEN